MFQLKDRVVVIAGSYAGDHGTVCALEMTRCDVHLDHTHNMPCETHWFYPSELQPETKTK